MVQRNLEAYHRSITEELNVLKDRIRNLIGNAHWQTDGEHKEAVLRKVLKSHIAESLRIGKGFICYPDGSSSKQIDILITDRNKPTLFKDGELILVTPDAVIAIIEVKTKQSLANLRETCITLSTQVKSVRELGHFCLAGLFIYEEDSDNYQAILEALQSASENDIYKVINWVSVGPKRFLRFWENGSNPGGHFVNEDQWRSYDLQNLSHAYFVSNVVWDTSHGDPDMQFAWFPVEGGKERFREGSISLSGRVLAYEY